MNKILLILSFLISFICFTSQSWALPPCPEDQSAYFNNCYGYYESSNGYKYIGEFKNKIYHNYT